MNFLKSALLLLMATAFYASSTTLQLDIELPTYNDGNHHRPYVAAWIEQDKKFVSHLFVWYKYDYEDKDKGLEWLKDLRQWWRKGGRKLDNPVDGLAGATRKPGLHTVNFDEHSDAVKALKAGQDYVLRVEVVREDAGRELINLPFKFDNKPVEVTDKGKIEVGAVTLNIK